MTDDNPVYLDHHATTPVDQSVVAEMEPYFTEVYGNPASDDHSYGVEADRAVREARERISSAINARSEEIIFTSGATESDNLAIRGTMEYAREQGHGNHLITAATEHEAVLELCGRLEKEGFEATILDVDENGFVDPDAVRDAIHSETVLVSLMAANNEIGTMAPIGEIGQITSETQTLFHTDAVQALGYRDLDVDEHEIDLMSLSGHKVYGPKGVGALYIRRRRPKVKIKPLVYGGGHERGYRSGTLNVPGVVGMGKAVELADKNMDSRKSHVQELRDHMWERLQDEVDSIILNGPPVTGDRLPNNLNVSFYGVENKAIVRKLRSDVAVSAGSACTTGSVEASHVLQALGGDEEHWHSAIRFGLGKDNTLEEIDFAVDRMVDSISRLRQFS
ncbi:cysteine desulfurase [Haloarcula sp. S1AR25-5A]|uniref:cysteine desulfurase n=1 Tax=Haloarcula terrestris TaxID=2950533 RepID=A0AAE4JI97_9EURY|nr:cysteine desulfurase family protein [Haloarcula terrestris]MDS0223462.1 cysteine desulfurase [Haloarcula terrestris]